MTDLRILAFEERVNPDSNKVEDWVLIAPVDGLATSQTWDKVSRFKIGKEIDGRRANSGMKATIMKARWDAIEPAYKAWKEGHDLPETGTPLLAWGALSGPQIKEFGKVGIRTIEELAEATDAMIDAIRLPGVRKLRETAQEHVTGRGQAETQKELVEARERMAAMEEMIAELQANARKPKKAVEK